MITVLYCSGQISNLRMGSDGNGFLVLGWIRCLKNYYGGFKIFQLRLLIGIHVYSLLYEYINEVAGLQALTAFLIPHHKKFGQE
ncbi:unnamed protein product [Rhizophagus irregularis]|uniref:Uncharacterized protein n=1 Tax=Rhizophagus irregularis TaxID=588596 RepID=A0A915ZLP2_9GLOM|nr:unnamed protein product [Rhizophagus irregularis]